MKAEQYRNLLFDLGNVIINIDEAGTHERMKSLFQKEWNYALLEEAVKKYETDHISTDIFINTLLSQCSPDVQALDIIDTWNSMLIDIPFFRLEMLTALRSKYNLYLISNTNALHLEWIHRYVARRYGVRDFDHQYFDNTYYSHLVKDRKPNESIFQHVIDDTLLTPELTLFIDDNQANIATAKKMGFGTLHVTDEMEIAEYLKEKGFY